MKSEESKNECRNFYDIIAPIYNNAILSNETDWIIRKLENKLVERIIRNITISSHDLILDVGAGTGFYSILSSNYFDRVVATDISDKMLKNMYSNGKKIMNVTSDSTHLPFNDNMFDSVLCLYGVLNYLNESMRKESVKEIHRVLKRDGRLIFSIWRFTQDHNFENWTVNDSGKIYSIHEDKLTSEEIDRLFTEADFNIIQHITVPNLSGRLYRKLLNKHIHNSDIIPKLSLVIYLIEKIIIHIPILNQNGWLFIGIAKKR